MTTIHCLLLQHSPAYTQAELRGAVGAPILGSSTVQCRAAGSQSSRTIGCWRCSIHPAQYFPFGYSNHCSVGYSGEELLPRSVFKAREQGAGTGRCYG